MHMLFQELYLDILTQVHGAPTLPTVISKTNPLQFYV